MITPTHPDKVFWPDEGYTKGDLFKYYESVADLILPYLKDRPESLNRFPDGINGIHFFQKNVVNHPDWVKTMKLYAPEAKRDIEYVVSNDLDTLLYLVNLGCIEINPWNSRINKLDNPDYLIIDLDPEDIDFEYVVKAARVVKEVCGELGIKCVAKTTGGRGIHIYVPLAAKYKYDEVREFGHLIAKLCFERSDKFTSLERHPAKRKHKVYYDYLQNSRGQTLASAYSVRPKPGAPVSTPLHWDEVNTKLDPKKFTIKSAPKRFKKIGDLWKPVLGPGANINKALKKIS